MALRKNLGGRPKRNTLHVEPLGLRTPFDDMLNECPNISIEQICLRTGLSRQNLYLYRSGQTCPSADSIYRLQKVLNLDFRPTDFMLPNKKAEIDKDLGRRLERALNEMDIDS